MSPDVLRSHLAELGLRSNGMRKCPYKGCAGTYEEWLTPEGYKRPLDPSTLLPHAYWCTRLQKSPVRLLDTLVGIVGLTFGCALLTLVMIGLVGFRNIGMGGLIVVAAACCVAACVSVHRLNEEKRAEAVDEPSRILDSWIVELKGIEQRQRGRGNLS